MVQKILFDKCMSNQKCTKKETPEMLLFGLLKVFGKFESSSFDYSIAHMLTLFVSKLNREMIKRLVLIPFHLAGIFLNIKRLKVNY